MTQIQDQTMALASMMQSAILINKIANGNSINQAAFDCSLDSLFTLKAQSIEEIFGFGDGLIKGLKTLNAYLSGDKQYPDRQIAYYVLSMIKIETKMMKDQPLLDNIQTGLETIQQQVDDFGLSQIAKAHKVDGLYQNTISHIKPRIIVQGDQVHLSNSDNTSKVRTLLFAGIRAAVLWRQKGGSRLKLLFSRKKYINQAGLLLEKF